jgi:hypothetical protein
LPSLAVKGEDGKVIKYPQGAERAAVAAYEFDAEARKKITASEGARDAQLERTVVDKLDQAVAAWKTREGLDQIRDFAEFARIKDVAQPLQTERLVDRLMRDGAITPLQRSRLDQMVKEYESALKAEWEAQTGTDVLKIVGLVGREKFEEGTRDALAALDRLLGRAAAGSGGENVRARFFDEMKPEERRALLEPLVAPAPAR